MDTINWILDSLSQISKRRCWVTSLQDANRRIEVRQGINKRGNFIQIIERRSREGMRFLLVPFDSEKDGPILFIRALSSFIQRASKSETNPVRDMDQSLSPTPDMELATSLPSQISGTKEEDDIHTSSFRENEGSELIPTPLPEPIHTERQMVIYEGTEPKFNISKTYTDLFTPLSRKMLSPYAPLFVPLSCNPFAALDNRDQEQDKLATCLEDEDPFSQLNEQSMVLSLNALEDHTKERDGPILYTHSEGEDIVFIDSKLKPLQIDLSRCSRHPLYLRKELKGRRTYSPSQIVTRSKAKLLEIGRRITPIGWEEEEDLIDPHESLEEEVPYGRGILAGNILLWNYCNYEGFELNIPLWPNTLQNWKYIRWRPRSFVALVCQLWEFLSDRMHFAIMGGLRPISMKGSHGFSASEGF
ncbi:hypothetical protein DM860_011166 [Cuscuta australis]|uniref:Uncharacterized protein n=1 Tax=Cuscuta australis TaxID=267555 RepID=A0A328DDE9_9ASTE|nr:hypothetical protein DM860_011166 [Cuscuta australis]